MTTIKTIARETEKSVSESQAPRVALTARWASARTQPKLVSFSWAGTTTARRR